MVSMHVREADAGRVRDVVVDVAASLEGRVEHALGGWTSVHAAEAGFDEAARAALQLSRTLMTDVVVAEARTRTLRMGHAREGAWCCGCEPEEADAPAAPPAIGMPGRGAGLDERARSFVDAMRRQQETEIAANAAWLRRHAQVLGLVPPAGDALTRTEEAALMRRARAALRSGPAGDARLEAARHELDERLARERDAFFALAAAHRDLLGLPEIPDPALESDAYFASVMDAIGRLAVDSLAAGADPQVPREVARHVRSLGLAPDRLLARTLPPTPFAWIP
jgi:hypothetical protein